MTETLYFLIPVFNEAENMQDLLLSFQQTQKDFSQKKCRFILLNDGSTDETPGQAKHFADIYKLDLTVLSLNTNQGPGSAFSMGFEYVSKSCQSQDVIITLEGDNTSRTEMLKTMLDRMDRENYDVVLASPYAYGGGFQQTSALRILMSHMANALTKIFLHIHGIHTLSSFFRVFKASAFMKLQQAYGPRIVQYSGFECMIELLAKAIHLQLSITEVPMKVDWSKRKGKSKMKVMRTIRGYFHLFWNARNLIFIKTNRTA